MARPIKSVWLFLLGLLGLHGTSAFADSYVICIGEAPGDSTRDAGCIDVMSWSWGANNSGGSNPVASLSDFTFSKTVDRSSDDLFRLAVTALTIKTVVEFKGYSDCCAVDPYLTIHFKDATIVSFQTGAGGNPSIESVTLAFDAVSYCFRPTVNNMLDTAQCYAYSKNNGVITPF